MMTTANSVPQRSEIRDFKTHLVALCDRFRYVLLHDPKLWKKGLPRICVVRRRDVSTLLIEPVTVKLLILLLVALLLRFPAFANS